MMKKYFILLLFSIQGINGIAQTCNPIDLSFGNGGIATGYTYNGNNSAPNSKNIIVQPDNKIIQIANIRDGSGINRFAVIRYKSNGSLDSSFGINGLATTSFGTNDSYAEAGALQADGKIVVTGFSYYANNWDFALARYNSNGSPDSSFGSVGKLITAVGSRNDQSYGLAVQTDGKIVVVGNSDDNLNVPAFTVIRYNNNGDVDNTFGQNGKIVSHLGHFITYINGNYYGTYSDEYARSVVIQPDGKILVAGESYAYNGCYHDDYYGGVYCSRGFAMVRYSSNGKVDSTFGNSGVIKDSSTLLYPRTAALQADGKILVTGSGSQNGFITNRYNSNGSLDSSFGVNGKAITQLGGHNSYSNSLLMQQDGKIVVAGVVYRGNFGDFGVVRYNSNGSPDNNFNINGIGVFHFGQQGSWDGATGVALQNNKLLVAGNSNYYSNNNVNTNLIVVRLQEINYSFLPVITPAGTVSNCQGDSIRLSTNETSGIQWYNNGAAISGATGAVYYAKVSGSYSIVVNKTGGCGASAPTIVSLNGPDEPIFNWSGNLVFCEGDSVSLTTYSTDNLQWYKDGNPVTGATTTTFKAKNTGSYSVKATNVFGCSTSSGLVEVVAKSKTIPAISANGPLNFCDGGNVILTTTTPNNRQWFKNGTLITGATNAAYTVTSSGTYTESNGCAISNPVVVTVSTIPPKPSIVWNSTYFFSATAGYAHYQWFLNNVAISATDTVNYKPVQTGLYKVQVTNATGCSSVSDVFNLVVLSVSDISVGGAELRYYPNPAQTILNVDVRSIPNKKLIAVLYDLEGRELMKRQLNQTHNQLPLQDLPSGLYQLVIKNGTERITLKLMIIK